MKSVMKSVMKTVMKSLIPLLVVASAVAVDVQKRVLNVKDCPSTEGQHYVVLRGIFDSSSHCGGNLISDQWILTAAHCEKYFFKVAVGKHPSGQETTKTIHPFSEKHIYKDTTGHSHDIMLLKLSEKSTLPTINLPPIGCTSPTAPFSNPYTIMGWSDTKYNPTTETYYHEPKNLQCGDVDLDPSCTGRSITVATPKDDHQYIKEHLLCSNSPCKSCPGDSGGSLVKNGVLVGVTAASTKPPLQDTLYMDVCAYRQWIKDTAGIN